MRRGRATPARDPPGCAAGVVWRPGETGDLVTAGFDSRRDRCGGGGEMLSCSGRSSPRRHAFGRGAGPAGSPCFTRGAAAAGRQRPPGPVRLRPRPISFPRAFRGCAPAGGEVPAHGGPGVRGVQGGHRGERIEEPGLAVRRADPGRQESPPGVRRTRAAPGVRGVHGDGGGGRRVRGQPEPAPPALAGGLPPATGAGVEGDGNESSGDCQRNQSSSSDGGERPQGRCRRFDTCPTPSGGSRE